MIVLWLEQAQECARDGAPFPIHGLSNLDIAELLHALSHSEKQGEVRMLFGDGSVSLPFPLPCLTPPTGTEPLWKEGTRRLLQIGLISRRHPLMDFVVHMYLLRNAETKGESHAMIEERAYMATRELLDDATAAAGADGILLELYQTGLEPGVVGFWRGVCETLRDDPGRLMLARPRSKRSRVVTDIRDALLAESVRLCSAYPDFFGIGGRGADGIDTRGRTPAMSTPDEQEPSGKTIWTAAEVDAINNLAERDDTGEPIALSSTGPTRLQWLPERPMRLDECDTIIEKYRTLEQIMTQLFEASQYTCGSEWGC